ncbi:hypothetical protein AAFF_G00413250 [Aldrovandia affinis]|uniref:Uncharacterized protein n=1 Tax=Aldrovandia affinis TaxID=143900 RepID=A0AAD7SAY6_9TELE|nr:hypothetical protein AAFF_G00413250 [Aldrovandia affinis]
MASPFTEMEVLIVLFSLVVFSLFTVAGLFKETYMRIQERENRSGNEDQEPVIVCHAETIQSTLSSHWM